MTYNAVCRVLEPRESKTEDDPLQVEHSEAQLPTQRCRLVKQSGARAATVFGIAANNVWACRLRSTKPLAAGWRIHARRNDQSDFTTYVVRDASRNRAAWTLALQD